MRILFSLLTFFLLNMLTDFNIWSNMAITLWVAYMVHFLLSLNHAIAFREYILMMYGLNYLFSPAITYEITQSVAVYKMKLDPETYFAMAIPGMLCLHIGLFAIKTKIFTYQFYTDRIQTLVNEHVLKQWLIAGLLLGFLRPFFPGDLAFIVYLLSGIKYVAAFALFIIDKKRYKWYLLAIVFLEMLGALRAGMFHDVVIWILFFSMVWTYLKKPNAATKTILGVSAILILFLLQSVKGAYRQALQTGEGGFSTLSATVSKQSGAEGGLFTFKNLALSFTRANQGWIFSSTVENMNRKKNFEGMNLLKIYAEAAVLPRFLAPNKLQAGDKDIFNKYSGAFIAKYSSTSMALGLFADGYVSYGFYGTLFFAFFFGLLCALVFKLIERWSAISPFFALFSFPLLNYAVRADCETQTWMGHIIKGVVVFSIVMYYTQRYFQKKSQFIQESSKEQTQIPEPVPQMVPNPV